MRGFLIPVGSLKAQKKRTTFDAKASSCLITREIVRFAFTLENCHTCLCLLSPEEEDGEGSAWESMMNVFGSVERACKVCRLQSEIMEVKYLILWGGS